MNMIAAPLPQVFLPRTIRERVILREIYVVPSVFPSSFQ